MSSVQFRMAVQSQGRDEKTSNYSAEVENASVMARTWHYYHLFSVNVSTTYFDVIV